MKKASLTSQRENKMAEKKELELSVTDSVTVRYGDVVITISAEENGLLEGRTSEQIIKYCADLLLRTTDASSLENFLDTTLAIEETLREDFKMNALETNMFLTAWRKRLYLKQIGEENPKVENFRPMRPVEPSSDAPEVGVEQIVADAKNPAVAIVDSRATISVPLNDKKIINKEVKAPEQNSFTVVEKDK